MTEHFQNVQSLDFTQCILKEKYYFCRYLNNQHIKKHKLSEAEVLYGNITPDSTEQMEVGELGLDVWKHNMIVPLKSSMLELLLDEFDKQRHNISMTTSLDIIAGVINSFVVVQEFRKKHPLEVLKFILHFILFYIF